MFVAEMVERRLEVVARLKALEEAAAPLVSFLQNPNAVGELRADKQYNLQMLSERYQVCYLNFPLVCYLSGTRFAFGFSPAELAWLFVSFLFFRGEKYKNINSIFILQVI